MVNHYIQELRDIVPLEGLVLKNYYHHQHLKISFKDSELKIILGGKNSHFDCALSKKGMDALTTQYMIFSSWLNDGFYHAWGDHCSAQKQFLGFGVKTSSLSSLLLWLFTILYACPNDYQKHKILYSKSKTHEERLKLLVKNHFPYYKMLAENQRVYRQFGQLWRQKQLEPQNQTDLFALDDHLIHTIQSWSLSDHQQTELKKGNAAFNKPTLLKEKHFKRKV